MTTISSNTLGAAPNPPAATDDAFASAFAQHAGSIDEGSPAPQPTPAPAADPVVADPPAADPPAADPPAADPAAGDAAPPAADAPPPAAEPAVDLAAQFAEMLKTAREQAAAPPAQPVQPQPQQPVQQPEQVAPVYSADEQALIDEYQKNWPDVAQAESLRRKGEYAQLLNYVFSQVAQYVAPVMTDMQKLMNEAHLQQVKGIVPDYSPTLESEVAAWVETQPGYLKSAYQTVMQTGTSDEVADLIGRFRASTGAAAPAPTPPAGQPVATPPASAPRRETELSRAAKQAAASLAPVGSERTSVVAGQDPGDFDSAFARFAAESGG